MEVTEADYKAVYAENKESFKVVNELRDLYFANFPIAPSE